MIINSSFNRIIVLIAVVSFLAGSCQKLEEYIHHRGNTDYKACNIKKIFVGHIYGELTDTTTYTFTYNWLGNPVSVINDHSGTGNPNYAFFYDNKNRLIQFLQPYTNGFYEKWDKYGYNNKGRLYMIPIMFLALCRVANPCLQTDLKHILPMNMMEKVE